MGSLVIYRDYTFSYSPSLMYPLRVWLMMCALCMREVGGWCLFSPVQQQQQTLTWGEAEGIGSLPATASDSSTPWVYFSYSPQGCISHILHQGVFLIFSTRSISHILEGAFLRSRKLTGGVAEGIGLLLAAAAGFSVHRTPASLLPHLFNTEHHRCERPSSYTHTVFLYHRAVLHLGSA